MQDGTEPLPATTYSGAINQNPPTEANIAQAKKELVDSRTISKKGDPETRKETARAILEARAKQRAGSQEAVRLAQIAGAAQISSRQAGGDIDKLIARLKTFFVRPQSPKGGAEQAIQPQAEENIIKQESDAISEQSEDLPSAKQLLDAYYEKVSLQPLSNEQKRSLLKPDVLASLTTEDYIILWKRLNPYFLAHITRQGFRDHYSPSLHSGGFQEFHDGFTGVLKDEKKLRPLLVLKGLKTRDEVSVQKYLESWVLQAKDEEEARERFNNLINYSLVGSAPKYPDETAVHFTTQRVSDEYYGGEENNEIFYIYPADTIASQQNFAFNGLEKDFTKVQNENMWNDVFVWPDTVDNAGISIDAGIVFLPEFTPVDSATGSKYASEIRIIEGQERRVLIEDSRLVGSFTEWGKNLTEESPVIQTFKRFIAESDYDNLYIVSRMSSRDFQQLGFTLDAARLLSEKLLSALINGVELTELELQRLIRESGSQWKRAENPIPAREFWEKYFTDNPNLRPKHVQYYDSKPTQAVVEFLQKNDIGHADTSGTEGKLLGFDDHHVILKGGAGYALPDQDPRAMMGYDELMKTADELITKHYGIKGIKESIAEMSDVE